MTARPVLVTGASGFLGRAVCRALADAGHPILAVRNRREAALQHPAVRWIRMDLTAADPLRGADHAEFGAIAHLAAMLPSGTVTAEEAARVNRHIDDCIFQMAAARGATVVYASGTSVYGETRTDAPVDENAAPAPLGPYPLAKLEGERAGAKTVRSGGGRFVALRVCAPYGPGQTARTVIQLFVERALAAEPLLYYGTGSREQAFTFVNDAAAAFLLALGTGDGCYNIAGGPVITMKELAVMVADLSGMPARLVQASSRPDPEEGLRARFDTGRAARELRWVPRVSLRDGLLLCLRARQSGATA